MTPLNNQTIINSFNHICLALEDGNFEKVTRVFDSLGPTVFPNLSDLHLRIGYILAPFNKTSSAKLKVSSEFCKDSAARIKNLVSIYFGKEDSELIIFNFSGCSKGDNLEELIAASAECYPFAMQCKDWTRNIPFIQAAHYYLRSHAQKFLTPDNAARFEAGMMHSFKRFYMDDSTEAFIETIQNLYLKPLATIKDQTPLLTHLEVVNSIISALRIPNKKVLSLHPFVLDGNKTDYPPPSVELTIGAFAIVHLLANLIHHFEEDFRSLMGDSSTDTLDNHLEAAFAPLDLTALEATDLPPHLKTHLVAHYFYLYEDCKEEAKQLVLNIDYFINFIKRECLPSILCTGMQQLLSGNRSPDLLDFIETNTELYIEFINFIRQFAKGYPQWETLSLKIKALRDFSLFLTASNLKALVEEYEKIEMGKWLEFIQSKENLFHQDMRKPAYSVVVLKNLDPTVRKSQRSLKVLMSMLDHSALVTSSLLIPYIQRCPPLDMGQHLKEVFAVGEAVSDEYYSSDKLAPLYKYRGIKYSQGVEMMNYKPLDRVFKMAGKGDEIKKLKKAQQGILALSQATVEDIPYLEASFQTLKFTIIKGKPLIPQIEATITRLKAQLKAQESTPTKETKAPKKEERSFPKSSSSSSSTHLKKVGKTSSLPPSKKRSMRSDDPPVRGTSTGSGPEDVCDTMEAITAFKIAECEEAIHSIFCIDSYTTSIHHTVLTPLEAMQKVSTGMGFREALLNAKNHTQNLLALSRRLYDCVLQRKSPKHYLGVMASSAAEGSLAVEQLLLALDLHYSPISTRKEYMSRRPHDHNLIPLLQRLEPSIKINGSSRAIILETNRGEIDSRRISSLVNRRNLTKVQKMLLNAFHYAKGKHPLASALEVYTSYCLDIFTLIFALSEAFLNKKRPKEAEQLNAQYAFYVDEVNRLAKLALAPSVLAPVEGCRGAEQEKVLMRIETIEKIVASLQKDSRIFYCNSKFDNLLNNLLPRLQAEIERQNTLPPRELYIHYSTALLLNQHIAEEMADIILMHQGKASLGSRYDHDLTAKMDAMGCKMLPSLEKFCLSGKAIRRFVRYHADETVIYEDTKEISSAKKHIKAAHRLTYRSASGAVDIDMEEGFTAIVSSDQKAFLAIQAEVLENTLEMAEFIEMIIKFA